MKDIHEAKILLVDDEPELLQMLNKFLRNEGYYNITKASTVADAMQITESFEPQVLLLDVMLPDGDGFELYEKLRKFTDAPVLFLSARDEDEAKLRGLGLGADDYITKPFLPKELVLRLGAVLRRTYSIEDTINKDIIKLGSVFVDMGSGTVSKNGDSFTLTAKEYALLKKLNENRGRIVTIDALCLAAWNDENIGYENTLMVHMHRLREKIETDPSHPKYLITVRGLGYRLLEEAKK